MENKQKEALYDGQAETEEFKNDLRTVLASPQGRRFLRRLLLSCHLFEAIPISDKASFAWYEGQRDLGLVLYHQIASLGQNHMNQLFTEENHA